MILKKGTAQQPSPEQSLPPLESNTPESEKLHSYIERARNGDAEAFGEVVGIYEKLVYSTACRALSGLGYNTSAAEDVAQNAFLKAWRSLAAFRGDCTFSTWLCRITINAAKDYARSRSRHGTVSLVCEDEEAEEIMLEIPVTEGDEVPEDAIEKKETIRAVREAIASLPEDQRRVVILRDLKELPYCDIAALLHIEVGTVKSRLNRGRQALKTILLKKNVR